MLVFRAEIHKMLDRIANRENPDKFVLFAYAFLAGIQILEHLL